MNEKEFIAAINEIILSSTANGGDSGGPYMTEKTSNCKKCVHYYINYYTSGMPPSCRSLKSPIESLNIINCPYFIEKPKNFMLSEEEINSLDSFMKHFND